MASNPEVVQRPSGNPDGVLNIIKRQLINLFPKSADCSYVSCYCEENVYKLCQDVVSRHYSEIQKCYAVFVSNPKRTVPLWRQRAGKEEDKLVVWDYHVVFLYQAEPDRCLVYDLDSELPFPTYVHKYVTETFRTDNILKPDYFRYFRVIPATEFLKDFTSDRRHMKRIDGSWIKPPPNYPAICNATSTHNLEDFIQMDATKGPGQVHNLTQFVQRFCKPAT
ncbi:PREDICTED: protein N-terminal glutamine amidohydrolase isoform X1 [Nicrophorus vespilloides]|uniref:Protein N-terminal glutamine amidohydrolase n=1 Tax=Nicrophorus vespilloides TaxID=110193 RepID=A0ABM1MQB7_NICVS|nr:PREDICTED: protein N-terminal glutamine amidohydrolase isoform X1 [Nicrophorus vespilloides]